MNVLGLDALLFGGSVRGRRVFVRADLNVPTERGTIADDTRIRASIPTLRRLLGGGARVVLASHLGRPGGVRRPELSLRPVAGRLAELLGTGVSFSEAGIGAEAEQAAAELENGQILLLENLRFQPGEEQNDPEFAKALGALCEFYVDDAFGTVHRAHASTAGIVAHVERAVAGDLLRSELKHLRVVLEPVRPFLCLLGGAKVSDKLSVLEALVPRADRVAIGGAMAYTFLAAQGLPTGASPVERNRIRAAKRVLKAAEKSGRRLLLPTDHVVAESLEPDAPTEVVSAIPRGWMGVDIGPGTAAVFAAEARRARTVFWNGPMGVFEHKAFARGTETVARGVAECEGVSVVGGGDTLAAVNRLNLADQIDHLSTGGGASLEYVQGHELPGLAVLEH
ncbi:MAG: phosphoglycerate kinase [Myxococcota bacterium]